jgi:hypothetical protein
MQKGTVILSTAEDLRLPLSLFPANVVLHLLANPVLHRLRPVCRSASQHDFTANRYAVRIRA